MTTYSALTTEERDADTPLTTVNFGKVIDNPLAMFEGAAGAPRLQEAALDALVVSQGKLKTAMSAVSTASFVNTTLPGGQYGFYPQSYNTVGNYEVQIAGSGLLVASYRTNVYLNNLGGGSVYAQQRYIQASPPYDLGDGEIPEFIFAAINKTTGEVDHLYCAPEAPWHNNGPTCIRADVRDPETKLEYMIACRAVYEKEINSLDVTALLCDPKTHDQGLELLSDPDQYLLEITQEIKNRDMILIPHPFIDNELTDEVIVMLDPVSDLAMTLFQLQQSGQNINTLFHDGYIKLDNSPLLRVTPPGVIAVAGAWEST